MRLPRVKKSCCGLNLEDGTLTIGFIEVVSLLVMIIKSSIMVDYHGDSANYPNSNPDDVKSMRGMLISILTASCIQLIFSGLLLWGVLRRNASLIKPWLIFAFIYVLTIFICFIISCVVAGAGSSFGVFVTITTNILIMLLKCYYFIVVYSYYMELVETGEASQQRVSKIRQTVPQMYTESDDDMESNR